MLRLSSDRAVLTCPTVMVDPGFEAFVASRRAPIVLHRTLTLLDRYPSMNHLTSAQAVQAAHAAPAGLQGW
jgi:hypothetical protein